MNAPLPAAVLSDQTELARRLQRETEGRRSQHSLRYHGRTLTLIARNRLYLKARGYIISK